MEMEDMILVSVDDHVCEPPDMWQRNLPAKWKDRAPRLVHKPDGSDVWVFEGKQIPNVGLNAVAGRAPEEYGMEPTALSQLRPGCYDIDARIGDMNANGVLGSLFIDDKIGVQNRDAIGIDNITWECDYPHSDTTWPNAPEILWRSVAGLKDDEIHKISWQNAANHFQYDPFQHIPKEKCTVGALRAQAKDVDLTVLRSAGGKPPSDYERGYATIGDIMKQIAGAFSTGFDKEGHGAVPDALSQIQKQKGRPSSVGS